jgi:DNA excision repair protein ERCC-2
LDRGGGVTYHVSVKALCSFTAKRGDLDMRFTPAPSALDGIQGHRIVASRRGSNYKAELSLQTEVGELTVRGRADGYDVGAARLDECKTFRGDFDRIPSNRHALHWAQVQTYGAQLCRRDALSEVELALVYFDIDNQEETILKERFTAARLEALFAERCEQFAAWARFESARSELRNASLRSMQFPFEFHAGQRQLADAVYRAAATSECLLAQAPTGVGKTLGTLFPMLKALGEGKLDKVFYLTAKGTGRALALDGVRKLQDAGAKVRVLDLVAREKACANPGRQCNGDSCPLAKGFYDRLGSARAAARDLTTMDQSSICRVALAHEVCPYYLSQEMVRWADVVVADYNHYFDHGGLLHTMTLEDDWRVGVLIDEAHNLIDRGRDMYSITITEDECAAALAIAPRQIKSEIAAMMRAIDSVVDVQEDTYAAYDELPRVVVRTVKAASVRLGELATQQPNAVPPQLLEFYFAVLQFCRLAEEFGEHSLFDLQRDERAGQTSISIRSVIPGAYLRRKFADAECAVLFSATLSPAVFYRDVLGLPKETVFLDAPSPFSRAQLTVNVAANISTRYKNRLMTLTAIVDLMGEQYKRAPGNYMFFASSFEYLAQVWAMFTLKHRDVRCWAQQRVMNDKARSQFIAEFDKPEGGIAFAVLGGAFAEGIDLIGDRLIGAFIATIGLPQRNPINDAMAERMETVFGSGFNYVYLYPGMRKVVQAAGRVIRSRSDSGSIHLIDERYGSEEVIDLLPTWWEVARQQDF